MYLAAAAAPATAPAASPGVGQGAWLGDLGPAGAALVITVVLVLGVKATGRGRALPWGLALILGALASTLYAAAGGLWSAPADLLGQLLAAVGVGHAGPLGNIGMGAAASICAAVLYWKRLTLKQVATWGFIAAYVAGRAGGIWGVLATAVASLSHSVGV